MSTTPTNKIPVNIEDEMKRSYMDYAMSVIIGRALPDVRDGLKPAHRRVLYGMRTMGLASVYRIAAGGSPSTDPKLPWPSMSGARMLKSCASRTSVS